MARIDTHWYRGSWWLWLLLPLSLLFCLLVYLRRTLYRFALLRSAQFYVPLIVVGNITVGGSGKTPLVSFLVELLRANGYRPGVVSRGYGGQAEAWPQTVTAASDPSLVGDEAVLLVRRCCCPMVVGPDRVAAVEQLLQQNVDVVISDDGLQHYRMGRDIEIAVLDGERRLGNGLCLPAGPLREGRWRLRQVDFVVANGAAGEGEWSMRLLPGEAQSLVGEPAKPIDSFVSVPLHAVAAIGNPGRFFQTLRDAGLRPQQHPFADHHPFVAGELDFADQAMVIMTEKDAVKYFPYADSRHWYLPVEARLDEQFSRQLLDRLERLRGQKTA